MKEQLMLVRLDTKYCDYLREFDNKVPYNYNEKELRPFVGVLFKIDKLMYFAPLSSPKPKHLKLKSKLDFLKINNGKFVSKVCRDSKTDVNKLVGTNKSPNAMHGTGKGHHDGEKIGNSTIHYFK